MLESTNHLFDLFALDAKKEEEKYIYVRYINVHM